MYVCLCVGVSERTIREAIDQGASSVEEVTRCTRAGLCCGSCKPTIAGMLQREHDAAPPSSCRRSLPHHRPSSAA